MANFKGSLIQFKYYVNVLSHLPNSFIKRILFGRDHLWKRWFWESWGFLPEKITVLIKEKPTIWICSSSGGEITQIFTFCKLLKEEFPHFNLLLSTNNYHAFKFAEKIIGPDCVFFSPWDIYLCTTRVLKQIHPVLLLTIEFAMCPVLLGQAKRLGYKTMLCSGMMSKNVHKHPLLKRPMALKAYNYFDYIGVKEEEDLMGFRNQGISQGKLDILGNLKYDVEYFSVSEEEKKQLIHELGLDEGDFIFLVGSTREGEERIAIDAYLQTRKNIPNLKMIIAPRFISDVSKVESYLMEKNLSYKKRTDQISNSSEVTIINTFGELARLYSIASIIFIGGSIISPDEFGYGQNIIEPLIHHKPILFGPHMAHWTEIVKKFKSIYPGLEVVNSVELCDGIEYIYSHPEVGIKLKDISEQIVDENKGGIEKHVEFIKGILTSSISVNQ